MSTYDNLMADVSKEINKGPSSKRASLDSVVSDGDSVEAQPNSQESMAGKPASRPLGSRSRLLRLSERFDAHSDIKQPPDTTARVRSDIEVLPERPVTRRSRRNKPGGGESLVVEDLPRWTEQNPGWDKHWDRPLVYNRSRVDGEDIPRLDEGQCLNDNIIDFGLRFLFDAFEESSGLTGRVYLHNTHFHTKLTSNKTYKGKINYDGVKNWTSKVDLLSYDYVVVPVNESYHWWLAIICNPGRLDPDATRPSTSLSTDKNNETLPESNGEVASDVELTGVVERRPLDSPRESTAADLSHLSIQSPRVARHIRNDVDGDHGQEGDVVDLVQDDAVEKTAAESTRRPARRGRKSAGPPPKVYDPQETRIITLDSLGGGHSSSVTCLKHYLAAEFEHKRQKMIESLPVQLGMKATNIPEQDNFCDCGVYLLGYAQEFFKRPDEFVHGLLQRETRTWNFNPSELRRLWRHTIMTEHRRSHGIDNPDDLEEPDLIFGSMKATDMPKNRQEEIVDTATTPTSPRPSSGAVKLPFQKSQARQRHVESPAESAPSPPDHVGPRVATGERSSEPLPGGTGLPGRWPSAESSSDEVSLLPPPEDKSSHSDAEPSVVEKNPDSWQGSGGPVKFIPTLPVSSPSKGGSSSEDITVSKYFEPKSPKVSGKAPSARRDSSEDVRVVGVNKVVRRNRAATPDERPSARRDSGDVSEITTSIFFAPEPPALALEKKPSVRERGVIALSHPQSRLARPPSSPASRRTQLESQPRRRVPAVQAAELVRPQVDIDLTKEEPGVINMI
jgi:hypothetical protein